MDKVAPIDAGGEKKRPSTESLRRNRERRRAAARPVSESAPKDAPPVVPSWLSGLEAELESRYYRLATPLNEYGYDPFGFDKDTARIPGLIMALAYRYWFRVESHGLDNVPDKGPVLL